MSNVRGRHAPACDLGLTGRRVRKALPAIAPPSAFRERLRSAITDQWSATAHAAAAYPAAGAPPPPAPQPLTPNP
jgi:hypothetical protein